MSREAFGDPPESQEPPQVCPLCGDEWHAEDCEFGKEVALRLKAERDAHKLAHALENVVMMLRKCAHRLRCNGHEDLSADAVGLLRRLDLLGSPLRDATPANLNDKAPSNAARCEGCAELRDQLRDMTRQSNLDAMRVGKLAEDVERYSALHARLFVEKTAAQIEAENLRELLHRMLEAPTTQISPSWKDAIRQALARAAPEFECLGEPSLCTNPRGCGCAPDSKTPNVMSTTPR